MAKTTARAKESAPDVIRRDAADGVKQLYIFGGDEQYLKEQALETIRTTLFAEGGEEFNYIALDGKTASPDDVYDAVESYPIFAERKLVVIRDFDPEKTEQDGKKKSHIYTGALAELPDFACVILITDKAASARKALGDKLDAMFKSSAARELEFVRPDDAELSKTVSVALMNAGRDINPADAEYLVEICAGADMNKLLAEVAKLASADSSGKRVTRAEIDKIVSPSPDAVAFDLTNAIASRDPAKALRLYRLLLARGEEVLMLLGLISSNIRRLYAVRLCRDAGLSPPLIAEELGISEKSASFVSKMSVKVDINSLRRQTLLCAQADAACKSGSDAELTVETLVLRLAGGL